jgi:glycosyltransferase involved in cell wall biosynthesis
MRIQFVEIDLRETPERVYLDHRYSLLWVLVLWGSIPLGWVDFVISPDMKLLSGEQILEKAYLKLGWQIWGQAIAGNLNQDALALKRDFPSVSVVVCTRDRIQSLRHCLESLKNIDYSNYEVLVVDNHSIDQNVPAVVTEHNCKYFREDRPGLDWARNRGIQESKHEIVAFIDDDALASPGWLSGLVKCFEDPSVMLVTGLVLPAEIETQAQLDFELYGGMSKGFEPFTIRVDQLQADKAYWASNWGVGANMALRRSLVDAIGYFNEALDVGTMTRGGGDIEFFYRTVAAGYALSYEPSGYVRHVHRRDKSAFNRQIFNNGRSFPAYLFTIGYNTPEQRLAIAWFGIYGWLWGWVIKRLIVGLIRSDRLMFRNSVLELLGSLTSINAYRKARKIALQI